MLFVLAAGCGRHDKQTVASGPCICGATNWGRYTPPGAGFTVLIPPTPRVRLTTNQMPSGAIIITNHVTDVGTVVAFVIAQNGFPPNVNVQDKGFLFASARMGALGQDGRMLAERSLSQGGWPGVEWKFEKFGGQAVITMRAFLVGREMFQAAAIMPKNKVCSMHVAKFLDSFEIQRKPVALKPK
ncbi:MAG: hypothetical protein JWR26_2437 [Pedosphaera sp.]|nr:hypothetical protein [Pedosphaera sp.]